VGKRCTGHLIFNDVPTNLLSVDLESDEYKFLLRKATDEDIDSALFRCFEETRRYRINQEKDRRLLAKVNNQLA
jgi:hypothetical protein